MLTREDLICRLDGIYSENSKTTVCHVIVDALSVIISGKLALVVKGYTGSTGHSIIQDICIHIEIC